MSRMSPRGAPTPPNSQSIASLAPLHEALIGADETRRQQAVRHVLRKAIPSVLQILIDGLIEVLGGRSRTACRQAGRSLQDLGPPVVPGLRLVVLRQGKPGRRRRAAEVLGDLGATLDRATRTEVILTLVTAVNNAGNGAVRAACVEAIARLRLADEPA